MAADTPPLLKQLSAELTTARALPVGAKTAYRCPAGLDQLKGVSFATVVAALPKPDYESTGVASYFLTSPVPPGQRGGGFPEITFSSGASSVVEKITCFYSK
jgi:hypothetical protein